jgi:hypothetical protein
MSTKQQDQRLLESLAKKGFTLYEGRKVTFVEAEALKLDKQRAIDNAKLLIKTNIVNELHDWSKNLLTNDKDHLKVIARASTEFIFINTLRDMLTGKALDAIQKNSIPLLEAHLKFLTQEEEEGTRTFALPRELDKIFANLIVDFSKHPEKLVVAQELINAGDQAIITLMNIYTGKITPDEIDDLQTTETFAETDFNNQQEEDCLLMGDDGICQDE